MKQKLISAFGLKTYSLYSSLLLFILVVLLGCDATSEAPTVTQNLPELTNFVVSPNTVTFQEETDGYKDTTITFNVSITPVDLAESVSLSYAVIHQRNRSVLMNGDLVPDGNKYSTTFNINTRTTSVLDLIIEVNAFNEDGARTFAQSYVEIVGFSNAAPVILFAENPETVPLPDQGSKVVNFTAKVTDEDGQNTIDGVFLRLISRASGEVAGSPFPLADNGAQEDAVAADSVYTASFTINPNNNPQTYDVLYYATDIGGLVSDTTRTTFRISSN